MRQGAFGIHLGQILRCGDEHCASQRQLTHHDLNFFARPGRRIDDDHVRLPGDVEDQIAQQTRDEPTPRSCQRRAFIDDEADGHHLESPTLVRLAPLARLAYRRQAPVSTRALVARVNAEQVRNVRSVQVTVQDADPKAHRREGQRQVDGYGRFADTAFATQHGQHVALGSEAEAAAEDPPTTANFDLLTRERLLQMCVQQSQSFARHLLDAEADHQPAFVDYDRINLRVGENWFRAGAGQCPNQCSDGRLIHGGMLLPSSSLGHACSCAARLRLSITTMSPRLGGQGQRVPDRQASTTQ